VVISHSGERASELSISVPLTPHSRLSFLYSIINSPNITAHHTSGRLYCTLYTCHGNLLPLLLLLLLLMAF